MVERHAEMIVKYELTEVEKRFIKNEKGYKIGDQTS